MVESVSATQSIQDTNAAYLAQMNAQKAANAAPQQAGASGFAQELQAIQKYELAPPTPLTGTKATSAQQAAAAPAPVSKTNITQKTSEAQAEEEACAAPKIARSERMACAEKATEMTYEDDDFTVADLVDFLNPLQHIPLLGTMYREATGDTIKPEVQVAGSILLGAATGSIVLSAIAGVASAIIEQSSGKEPLVQVADALWDDEVDQGSPIMEDKIVVAGRAPAASAQMVAANDSAPDASAAAAQAVKVAQATETAEIAAPVVAANTALPLQHAKAGSTLAANTASIGAPRVGNVIYTSPMLRSAAKVTKTATATPVTSLASAATASKTEALAVPKAHLDNTTLGSLIHEQAKAKESGQQLPPELVQDMMLMAMDKYKAAHVASAQTGAPTTIQ